MLEIRSVEDVAGVDAAKQMFREYGQFLRERIACGEHFDFQRYLGEIERLPEVYSGRRGEVLVGFVDGTAAAMIVCRESPHEGPESAEVKRLFVRPIFRGQGFARKMVEEALGRIKARGFRRVILDTNVEHMPAAFKLYQEFGFREYGDRVEALVLMELEL